MLRIQRAILGLFASFARAAASVWVKGRIRLLWRRRMIGLLLMGEFWEGGERWDEFDIF